MKRFVTFLLALLCMAGVAMAQRVTVHARNKEAAVVFADIMRQTDKNFVYSSQLLRNVRVSVDATGQQLSKVLDEMFRGTDIEYRIKGRDVILKPRKAKDPKRVGIPPKKQTEFYSFPDSAARMLEEVVVVSRLEAPAVETAEIGAKKLTAREIIAAPVLLGESDVIKTLQMQPGVSEGTEGLAGMYVHGGNADENLCMLDNVPLYQVNHFAGLFSAFNPEVIRYIDFFKSSIPAKYDGRLSSFLDVRTISGTSDGHHGTGRLGLTSGAFNISGPIGNRTTYMAGVRRSWYDVLTVPAIAIANASNNNEKIKLHYYFMDANAKVTHRFSNRMSAFMSLYYGDDLLKGGNSDKETEWMQWYNEDNASLHWGNVVAQTGMNLHIRDNITAEFTAAYTRYFSSMEHETLERALHTSPQSASMNESRSHNNINDWIFRADLDWKPMENQRIRFGAAYTRHSFLPSRSERLLSIDNTAITTRDSTTSYRANEGNVYIEDDWRISGRLHVNAGIHTSLFAIDERTHFGLSPRFSAAWRISDAMALKGAYSRTTQYVYQLARSNLALPTDQWIPITGNFKPQTADKVSAGAYWQTTDGRYSVSLEGYWKWMRNIIDYRDEYYLRPPLEMWNARLTSGRGTAKGLDFKIEKTAGHVTGHLAYSLAWSDRTFADKNGGRTFPARFDNRHTINIALNWRINSRVQLNAAWAGHSGNRFTLLAHVWETEGQDTHEYGASVPLQAPVNNYQLPFYHRLDLSCRVDNSRGYWTFGLYNAYSHMNVIAVERGYDDAGNAVFKKVKLLPAIPSVSYTWIF